MKKIRQKIIAAFQILSSRGVISNAKFTNYYTNTIKTFFCCFLMFIAMQGVVGQTSGFFPCGQDACLGAGGDCDAPAPEPGEDCNGADFGCDTLFTAAEIPPAPVVTSESVCQPDNTLDGGVIDFSGVTCPTADLVLEFSVDGGITFTTTAPVYDQDNPITIDVRCTCNEISVSTDVASVTTMPGVCVCPNITAITPDATEVCSGTDINVCIDFDIAIDAAVVITADVNGVMGVGVAGETQICVDVPTDNQTCDPVPLTYTIAVDCDGVDIDATAFVVADAQVFPQLDETIVQPDCMAEAGSAILTVAGGGIECANVVGTVGVPNVCPDIVDTDASLIFDFSTFDSPCFTGTVQTDPIDCAVVCPIVCDADAPTISIDCTDCGDGTFGGPCTVVNAGDGSANAGEITEFIVIDDAAGTATGTPDGIIAVGAIADAQAAVDGLADGEEVCVTALTHVQVELDGVIAALDAELAPLGIDLGLPVTGNTLAGVFAAIQAAGGGATVDLATIEDIIANGDGGLVDLGAILGFPPDALVIDIPPFCYDVDAAVCVTGNTCPAPVSTIIADPCDCAAGEDTNGDGVNDIAFTSITITDADGAGQGWDLTSQDGNFVDIDGVTPIGPGSVVDNGDGTYTVTGYITADGVTTYNVTFTATDGEVLSIDSNGTCDCATPPADIPTLSQW